MKINYQNKPIELFPYTQGFQIANLNPENILNVHQLFSDIKEFQNFLTINYKKTYGYMILRGVQGFEVLKQLHVFFPALQQIGQEFYSNGKIVKSIIKVPLSEDCIIFGNQNSILFYFSMVIDPIKKENIIGLVSELAYNLNKGKNEIFFQTSNGKMKKIEFAKPSIPRELAFNEDTLLFMDTMIDYYENKTDAGIVLLTGEPGTGISEFLRYMLPEAPRLFVIPDPISLIADIYMTYEDNNIESRMIYIIENIEEYRNIPDDYLIKNDGGYISDIVHILNRNIPHVLYPAIITSNTHFEPFDEKYFQKERLIGHHNFSPLEIPKANTLAEHLGLSARFSEPVLLHDIVKLKEKSRQVL